MDSDSVTAWIQSHDAARFCEDMVYGWYADWFLPAKDELNMLYTNKTAIWGFAADYYWSSTEESNATVAWYQYFLNGTQTANLKNQANHVRCIRKI